MCKVHNDSGRLHRSGSTWLHSHCGKWPTWFVVTRNTVTWVKDPVNFCLKPQQTIVCYCWQPGAAVKVRIRVFVQKSMKLMRWNISCIVLALFSTDNVSKGFSKFRILFHLCLTSSQVLRVGCQTRESMNVQKAQWLIKPGNVQQFKCHFLRWATVQLQSPTCYFIIVRH